MTYSYLVWLEQRVTVNVCCRGFAVGIYATNSAEACQYVAANCKANILVVENQKQLQKILQVRPDVSIVEIVGVICIGKTKIKKSNLIIGKIFSY